MQDIQNELRRRMDDIEKNTIWKISDCSHMIKNRPTEQFVTESLKNVNQQLTRELGGRLNLLEMQQDRMKDDFKKKHDKLEEETKNRMHEYKETFKKVLAK